MSKIFISHAHEDRDAAHQITVALTKAGLDPWLDVQELRFGDELLKTIARVLTEVDYFAVVLSKAALAKPWVLTELRMALTSEIENGRPNVLVLRLDDCEIPIELRHKLYLDLRGRFDAALTEFADHVKGVAQAVPTPKQTVLAEMIKNADAELWARLSAGAGKEWRQNEAAEEIRGLRTNELEAAVSIGWKWSGLTYKMWEGNIIRIIRQTIDTGDVGALRILKRLAVSGFLDEAKDLDYSRQSERAWCDGGILWILRRAARRSGLFSILPPPLPERISRLLTYENSILIFSSGWYAFRFAKPILTTLHTDEKAIVVIARDSVPPRTWAFRSPADRTPLRAEQFYSLTELTPGDPFASLSEQQDQARVGFDLVTFDDLSLL